VAKINLATEAQKHRGIDNSHPTARNLTKGI
jgi:hypothetical protein